MCTMSSPKQALDLAHFEVWEQVENNMLPIPFDHSLFLIKIVQLQLSSVLLAKICAREVITCTGGLQEVTTGSCPFKV